MLAFTGLRLRHDRQFLRLALFIKKMIFEREALKTSGIAISTESSAF
jgi:hypothetical protein